MEISDEEVARYWDGNAELWASHVRAGCDAYREHFNNPAFLEFVGDLKNKTVLDAGCGEGLNTRILARAGARMTGVDISPKMIELARADEKQNLLGIRYQIASFSDLSLFEDGAFDVVVSFMALMDGADYEGAVREMFRVLRPGGELIFSIRHPCFCVADTEWIPDEDGNDVKLAVTRYFESKPYVEHWRFSKAPNPTEERFEVPFFPRTLSDYINPLIEAGFILNELHEPRPTEEACRRHLWLRRWRDHAAMFLYVRTAKP